MIVNKNLSDAIFSGTDCPKIGSVFAYTVKCTRTMYNNTKLIDYIYSTD